MCVCALKCIENSNIWNFLGVVIAKKPADFNIRPLRITMRIQRCTNSESLVIEFRGTSAVNRDSLTFWKKKCLIFCISQKFFHCWKDMRIYQRADKKKLLKVECRIRRQYKNLKTPQKIVKNRFFEKFIFLSKFYWWSSIRLYYPIVKD